MSPLGALRPYQQLNLYFVAVDITLDKYKGV